MKLLTRLLPLMMLAVLGANDLGAQSAVTPGYTESEIKAAFILHLMGFVHWQDGRMPSTVCMTEEDATYQAFGALLEAKNNQSVVLMALAPGEEFAPCDLLFISSVTEASMPPYTHEDLLTVGDSAGFAESGGMIEFRRAASRVGLVVNSNALGAAGLSASSRLLSLATVVPGRVASP